MSITFSGLATGLDTDSIVSELIALERAPIDRLETKKTQRTERLEAYAQFDSKLEALQTAVKDMSLTSQVSSTAISLSSEDSFSATSSSGAVGSYEIAVAQLAQVQKTVTNAFSSKTDSIFGTGTITVNGTNIDVTDDNNSLAEIAASINELSETTGVQATIINNGADTDPYHLVFTGQDATTSFTVSSVLSASVGLNDTTDSQDAQQGIFFVDGIKIVSDTNTVSEAISGVTINLNSVATQSYAGTTEAGDPWEWDDPPVYETTRMDVESDTGALKEKVTSFVTTYNEVMEWILSGYEEFGTTTETDDESEEVLLGSVLRGDSTINNMKRQLQNLLTSQIDNSGDFSIIAEIGITTNLNGTLNQDNTVLDEALENNFDDMVYLLAGDDDTAGVMKDFKSLLLDMTSSSTGMYANQKVSYDNAIDRLDNQVELMEIRMTKRETLLRSQYSVMEQLVSGLNAQGDFLTQQLAYLTQDN